MTIEAVVNTARQSFLALQNLSPEQRNVALRRLSEIIDANQQSWLAANANDIAAAKGLPEALQQRLHLSSEKVYVVSQGVRDVSDLPEILDQVTLHRELAPGLKLKRKNVPIGVIAIIFESRPDVLPQILALTLKTANAVILKGGKETQNSNDAFMKFVAQLNAELPFLPSGWAQLVSTREDVHELLKRSDLIDLVIPRGSNELVQSVMNATKIPVLGHADGVCHIFANKDYDLQKAAELVLDAKLQYPSACNALETLLVHQQVAPKLLPMVAAGIEKAGGQIFGCAKTKEHLPTAKPVENWHFEHGNNNLSIRVVDDLEMAIQHINAHGSKHTDCILTNDSAAAEVFLTRVDAAGVFHNTSTRFADGFRYGFGAEIGVSTSKTHARGPVGLEGLVSYKYVVVGDNHRVAEFSGLNAKKYTHKDIT